MKEGKEEKHKQNEEAPPPAPHRADD